MATAIARIVVQATPEDKKAIAAKAARLQMPMSELMRQGAIAFEADSSMEELEVLADAAKGAAKRAGVAIDGAARFVESSNARLAALEEAARTTRPKSLRDVERWLEAVVAAADRSSVNAAKKAAPMAPRRKGV